MEHGDEGVRDEVCTYVFTFMGVGWMCGWVWDERSEMESVHNVYIFFPHSQTPPVLTCSMSLLRTALSLPCILVTTVR